LYFLKCRPVGVGQPCDQHADCDSHYCEDGACAGPSWTDVPPTLDVGAVCATPNQCKTGLCEGGRCVVRDLGENCERHGHCLGPGAPLVCAAGICWNSIL
jgi:hypothetical protein